MDAFKLLSRSTKLTAKTKTKASNPRPSNGQAPNPQLFGQDDVKVRSASPQGGSRKRKRGQDAIVVEEIPQELDFFGGASGRREDKQKKHEQQVSEASTDEHLPAPRRTIAAPKLSSDECKRLLRSHKIKIASLYTPETSSENAKIEKTKKTAVAEKTSSTDKKKHKAELIVQPLTSFSQLRARYNIASVLAENLDDQGYSTPTEIQLGALPLLLGSSFESYGNGEDSRSVTVTKSSEDNGKTKLDVDLLSIAPTGSGKTLAFLIPVLAAIMEDRRVQKQEGRAEEGFSGPKAIIIAPTKELASQITNEGRKLSRRTGVKVTSVKKGMRIVSDTQESEMDQDANEEAESEPEEGEEGGNNEQKKAGKNLPPVKADILVSTPLTLLHAITSASGSVQPLQSVRYLVLDEADVLLDPLFREQTTATWLACTNPLLRVSLWSATMGSSIEDLAASTIATRWSTLTSLHPTTTTRSPLLRLIVGLKDTSLPTITHTLTYCATEAGKLLALRSLLRPTASSLASSTTRPSAPPFLIFTQTIPRAIALHSELLYDIPPEAGGATRLAVLHSDLTDTAREAIMARFRRADIWVLITTDLLSRGVDFRGLNGVVNYDFPASSAAYVHRVGRTGRAGREGGVAVTLYAKEDVPFVKNVANVIAASERQRRGGGGGGGGDDGKSRGMQQWMLDALPTPSKREKQGLKRWGVASRNGNGGEGSAKSRISTKSGYERKVENNRKGAVVAARRRKLEEGMGEKEDEGFGGLGD